MKVRTTPITIADLAGIEDGFSRKSPSAALTWSQRLQRACFTLGRFPRRRPRAGVAEVRRRPVAPYLISYRVRDEVQILRIVHGARDWLALLGEAD